MLLLDEPLGALDAQIRKQMQLELKNIQKQLGQTFVYVTHDQEESLTMSDNIVIMHNGRIEQFGTPEEVYESPATPFVASFLGDCNMLSGTLTKQGAGQAAFHHPQLGYLPGRLNGEKYGPAVFCVRPENMTIVPATTPGKSSSPSLEGRVVQRIYRGVVTRYIVRVADEQITAETLGKGSMAPGDLVLLSWEEKNAVILPAEQTSPAPAEPIAADALAIGRVPDEVAG